LGAALKVVRQLREWFPSAWIAGWKYELDGGRAEALEKAFAQIQECRTDACVLNGAAYGDGFAVCRPGGGVQECADAAALAGALIQLIGGAENGAGQ
jgi:phosphopantothenate---cysteine ligase (CTP)